MFKLYANKNHPCRHDERMNNQNINDSECFGVEFVEVCPEVTSQWFFEEMWFWLIV